MIVEHLGITVQRMGSYERGCRPKNFSPTIFSLLALRKLRKLFLMSSSLDYLAACFILISSSLSTCFTFLSESNFSQSLIDSTIDNALFMMVIAQGTKSWVAIPCSGAALIRTAVRVAKWLAWNVVFHAFADVTFACSYVRKFKWRYRIRKELTIRAKCVHHEGAFDLAEAS